jgi:hypothetical protein
LPVVPEVYNRNRARPIRARRPARRRSARAAQLGIVEVAAGDASQLLVEPARDDQNGGGGDAAARSAFVDQWFVRDHLAGTHAGVGRSATPAASSMRTAGVRREAANTTG